VTDRPRRRLQLRKPRGSLTGFPTWTLRPDRALYRAHKAAAAPWWFSSDGSGRFDLRRPHGTCYLASDPEAAVRERWGEELLALGYVPRAVAEATEVSELRVPKGGRLADFCAGAAAGFGVTREISTTGRYDVTQTWANALGPLGSGLRGVRYQPRLSTDARGWALGLFGDACAAAWPAGPNPVGGVDLAARLGIEVAGIPSLSALNHVLRTPSSSIVR
jgi:RES domain-containing protein